MLAALAAALPARGFFVGDPGVKLIAARNALDHPSRPLEISLPRVGGLATPLVDPFFRVHGDHAHAVTSELLPILTAPLIAAFGIRGASVLPAAGFLAALAAIAWLGRRLDRRRSPPLIVVVGAVCTPLLFYGLEFWDHTLAVAAAAAGTALMVGGRPLAAGLLLGVAVMFRPEAAWYAVAVGVGVGPGVRPGVRPGLAMVAGIAIALAPLALFWLVHTGHPVGPHIAGNLAGLGADWAARRAAIARTWFGSLTARESLWAAAPTLVVALAASLGGFRGPTFLWRVAILDIILVLLTAPNDGGGQWGPRYLLLAFVPLTILLADAVAGLLRRRAAGLAIVALVLASGAWTSRSAYKDLRSAKTTYARIVDFVERESVPDGYIVTDLWWLDQIAASLYPHPAILYAANPDDVRAALGLLHAAGASSVTLIRSDAESDPRLSDAWTDGPYRRGAPSAIPDRSLVAWHLTPR